jgi:glutathione S-transferase
MPTDLRLIGSGSSPYTRKLRAALRYRRIPYRFVVAGSEEQKALPERPLPLMPCLVFPNADGCMNNQDTPRITRILDPNRDVV